MPTYSVEKLWTLLSAFIAAFTIDAWLASAGGPSIMGALILDERRNINSFYSSLLIAFSLISVSLLGHVIARRYTDATNWASRFPRPAFFDQKETISPHSKSYKAFQLTGIFFILIVPMASQIHLPRMVLGHTEVWDRCSIKDSGGCENNLSEAVKKGRIPSVPMGCYALPFLGYKRCSDISQFYGSGKLRFVDRSPDIAHYACVYHGLACSEQNAAMKISPGCRSDSLSCRGEDFYHPWTWLLLLGLAGLALLCSGSLLLRVFLGGSRSP